MATETCVAEQAVTPIIEGEMKEGVSFDDQQKPATVQPKKKDAKADLKASAPKAESKAKPQKRQLRPGDEVIYWDRPLRRGGELTERYALIAELVPGSTEVHLSFLSPAGWLPICVDESDEPTLGKFTRYE